MGQTSYFLMQFSLEIGLGRFSDSFSFRNEARLRNLLTSEGSDWCAKTMSEHCYVRRSLDDLMKRSCAKTRQDGSPLPHLNKNSAEGVLTSQQLLYCCSALTLKL